jgi:hypothetical protein
LVREIIAVGGSRAGGGGASAAEGAVVDAGPAACGRRSRGPGSVGDPRAASESAANADGRRRTAASADTMASLSACGMTRDSFVRRCKDEQRLSVRRPAAAQCRPNTHSAARCWQQPHLRVRSHHSKPANKKDQICRSPRPLASTQCAVHWTTCMAESGLVIDPIAGSDAAVNTRESLTAASAPAIAILSASNASAEGLGSLTPESLTLACRAAGVDAMTVSRTSSINASASSAQRHTIAPAQGSHSPAPSSA